MKNKKVGIGTRFRYTFADGNPLWEVKKARGAGTWDCVVVNDLDYVGTKKTFSTEEIQSSLNMSEFWKQSADESEEFYKTLKVGSIVHYHNSFGAYVRCEVTEEHQLMPIALVGNWSPHDLPRRMRNGEIDYGYHVKQLQEKKLMKPHASNVWEYNMIQRQSRQPVGFSNEKDPRQMTPISLDVPPMTEEQKIEAGKYKKLEMIQDIVKSQRRPDEIFAILKNVLESGAL